MPQEIAIKYPGYGRLLNGGNFHFPEYKVDGSFRQ
jgi:hypothetical protein